MHAIMPNTDNNVTHDWEDDPPDRLYRIMGGNRGADLDGIFVEDVGGGVVAEFEIDFFLARIFETIEIGV